MLIKKNVWGYYKRNRKLIQANSSREGRRKEEEEEGVVEWRRKR